MQDDNPTTLLRIDASVRRDDSLSRRLGDDIVSRLRHDAPDLRMTRWDTGSAIGHIDANWVDASFTSADRRSPAQQRRLARSDAAVAALNAADIVLITTPIYNFSVPSTLRAWIDQVCRPGLTFRYGPRGPEGLLRDRPVYLAVASGGVALGSDADFATGYLRQVLGFIGIRDVRLVGAEGTARDPHAALARARERLATWLPATARHVA
jgi:FMN-dependent NADH-azoreductase